MSIPPSILLNLLSSGVRAVSGVAPSPGASPGASDFSSMLGKARAGELSTGLPVTIARNANIDLSDDQLSRLAQAADRAESAGARRALVLMDGRALEIDIATRQVGREHPQADSRVITGIDAMIDLGGHAGTPGAEADAVGGSGQAAPVSSSGPGLDRSGWNRSLLEALARR